MLRRVLLSAGRRLAPRDLAPASHATATRDYAKSARGRVRGRRGARGAAPPPPTDDPWEEVRDEATGQTYWWNVRTNETTALGAEKPRLLGTSVGNGNAPPPVGQPQRSDALARPGGGSMLGGFGSMVAEGMAFGTGSALAHRAIGSLFGGGDYGYGGGGAPAPGSAPPPEAPASDAFGGGWGDEMDDVDGGDGGSFFDGFDFDALDAARADAASAFAETDSTEIGFPDFGHPSRDDDEREIR